MARMKSALLVDFDNIASAVGGGSLVSKLPQWLLWMEDGALSGDGRRRKFLSKRVYWNSQFDKHRAAFEAAGFEAFTCKAFVKTKLQAGKSSADTFITMDAVELARDMRGLEELIILTPDSDFVPVVNRVQGRDLRVVTAGKETDPTYSLYSQHADAVIHVGALKAACEYERVPRKWYRFRSPPPEVAPLTQAAERASPLLGRLRKDLREQADEALPGGDRRNPLIGKAARLIVELGERTPDQAIAKKKIIRALSGIDGFTPMRTREAKPWFGHRSYLQMMNAISHQIPQLEVKAVAGGGVHVIYREPIADVQPDEAAPRRVAKSMGDTTGEAGSLLDKGPRGGLQAEG